jgi:hypothetical protein
VKHKFFLLFLLFLLFCVSAGFAADTDSERGDFWFSPCGEAAFYSFSGLSYGGGLAVGYGSGTSVGMKVVWFPGHDEVSVIEINFLLRFYFAGKKAYSGSFLQFMGGPAVFFNKDGGFSIPSKNGSFSLGMGFGWRFLVLERWFVEPSVRVGYPYLIGAGLALGMRF